MPKVGMVSLGCPKNLVDSEVMLGILARQGYEPTHHPSEADVIVVNTCGFIEPAKRESIDTILEMAEYKKGGRAQKLVVAGCLVERYRREILSEFPEVDFVIGTNELESVLEACLPETRGREAAGKPQPYLYHELTPRVLATPSHTAYIKIAEGCDHPCAFCVIPRMRGKFRSRRMGSIVQEAENLARMGVREITLVGQDNTSYGEDLGIRDGLATLLGALGAVPDLVWVRFLYCYPNRVTNALIEAVARTERIPKYFDIPLQHASGRVLKAMRRGGNAESFLRLIERIRAAMPGVTLRTSMITGFPGESEEDFNELADFIRAAQFDHLGVFLYSNEESSASYSLPGQVPAAVAARRRNKLMAIQKRISARKLRRLAGQRLPLLVEGRSAESELLYRGRLATQSPEIDGHVLINDFGGAQPAAGQYRWATITETHEYDLVARVEADFFAAPQAPEAALAASRLVQIQTAAAADSSHAMSHL
jgi:ribosomal protein S12 methylthiotransferase